ncbi:MAG: 4Fe-4S ferredoxin [Candidatus Omnitrophica bacterium CG11_big_fil_rev_8_21_14_0_20_42_13]|uniref:4Fe-4S ferredoxin n=1 Tax=Candidatus Ghiorseimicrobium undicola TaxID=1974746 RepID=A0A2H0LWT8_9BACT|nr:MAG: 4Fe-4S ferredoxin [Candidatus Omnitrophica bacterium CG11_big_fil_rev_8_21_14_0_20_42_13]
MAKKLYYDVSKCLACKSCELVCAVGKSSSKELQAALSEETKPLSCVKVKSLESKNFPIACRHCKEHPCVSACIAGALSYDKTKKLVDYDRNKCVGCWMCVMVCPYGAIRDNKALKIPVRCDLCQDADEPRCLKACPVGAIIYLEEEELDKLLKPKKSV